MEHNIYETLPLNELEKLVYALQISYHPPLTEDQRPKVIADIIQLREKAETLDFEELKLQRKDNRLKRNIVCNDAITYIGRKDVLLMSDYHGETHVKTLREKSLVRS